jgi:Met-zincin/Domain of unknown function (DUF5117)
MPHPVRSILRSISACLLAVLGAQALAAPAPAAVAQAASAPFVAAPAAAAPPARPASAPAALPPPGGAPPFATVIRDAKDHKGLFTLWQKDEKVWIELKPEDFDKPFFLSPKLARGLGENLVYGGMMSYWGNRIEELIVEFRRVHNLVQLVAVNTATVTRDPKSPQARAVAAAFAPSLLASTPVASQPHPERKTVLIEAAPIFLNDLAGLGSGLQRIYRQGYSLEGRNTNFASVRSTPEQVVFNVNAHFYSGGIASAIPGAPPGAPLPSVPRFVPDPRSLYLGLHYALAALPEQPMARRKADSRIGHFTSAVFDFSDDIARTPTQRHVQRWRLEKKDVTAPLSEPVKPIVFWIDRTMPLKYRDAVTRGVLEWNQAFERIGFSNAIVVKVQPEDADFDTLDVGVASVRWMTNAQIGFGAIGPSHVDPRSGEILDADIALESLDLRGVRSLRSRLLQAATPTDWLETLQAHDALREAAAAPGAGASEQRLAELMSGRAHGRWCTHADHVSAQTAYALDVWAARGEIDPDSPEAEQFVQDKLVEVVMHEVGHALGLQHNFRASRVFTERQLSDPDFVAKNGISGSVMEYTPINLARPGQPRPAAFQTRLGPYDFWAVEYAYKPFHPDHEAAELQRIAGRSGESELAFANDLDAAIGIDPEVLQVDLGDDAVAFASKRLDIMRDLIARQETRLMRPSQDYSALRRSVNYAIGDAGRAAGILARQIGGVRTLRDHPGSGREPLTPIPAAVQRQALDVLAKGVFAAGSFALSPTLQRRLAPDYGNLGEAFASSGGAGLDYSLAGNVLGLQRALLAQLMSDGVASRLLDSEGKFDKATLARGEVFRLTELHNRLAREIWSELAGPGDIGALRRELQREHANRLAALLLRPVSFGRADARGVLRVQAQELRRRIASAGARPGLLAEARAHLADAVETLGLALEAKLLRAGV